MSNNGGVESTNDDRLRPIERVVLRLSESGESVPDIARRIGKRPGTVERILTMIDYKKDIVGGERPSRETLLTPLERVVVRLRAKGENYGEIGSRLGRSGVQIRRIESYISFKSA